MSAVRLNQGVHEQGIAAEVLELGANLLDAAIAAAATTRSTEVEEPEPVPVEELRAAADEFFTALRLLLGLEAESA